MANKLKMHVYNMVMDPNVVLSSTTEDAAYPLSNLQNPLISRPYKATSNAAQRIVLDLNAVNAGLREATDVILAIHNLTTAATVKIEANPTNSWGTPASTVTKSVPLDLETHADFWKTWHGRPPGLIDFNSRAVRNLYYPLAADISSNRYVSVYIDDPTNDNPISIGKAHVGWGLQFAVNFDWGWAQQFQDNGSSAHALLTACSRVSVSDVFAWRMSFVSRIDARIARYLNYRIGKRYCFVSFEPENADAMTEVSTVGSDYEIRQHTMTMYGLLNLPRLSEKQLQWLHDFDATFESIGIPALPGNEEVFEDEDAIDTGGFDSGDGTGFDGDSLFHMVDADSDVNRTAVRGVWTFTDLITEDFDPDAMHDMVDVTERRREKAVSAGGAGVYACIVNTHWDAGAEAGTRNFRANEAAFFSSADVYQAHLNIEQAEMRDFGDQPCSIINIVENELTVGAYYEPYVRWNNTAGTGTPTLESHTNAQAWRVKSRHSGIGALDYVGSRFTVGTHTNVPTSTWHSASSSGSNGTQRYNVGSAMSNRVYTAQYTGLYSLTHALTVTNVAADFDLGMRFWIAGATAAGEKMGPSGNETGSNTTDRTNYTLVYLTAGQTVNYQIWHNFGVDTNFSISYGASLLIQLGWWTTATVTNQSISSHATDFVALSFSAPSIESEHVSWSSGAPTKFVCKRDGALEIGFNGEFTANATGTRIFELRKNGSATAIARVRIRASNSQKWAYPVGFTDWDADVDDYYEIFVRQDSGSSLNCSGTLTAVVVD